MPAPKPNWGREEASTLGAIFGISIPSGAVHVDAEAIKSAFECPTKSLNESPLILMLLLCLRSKTN